MAEKLELSNAKGTKDALSEEMLARQKLFDILKATFERYGFNPLETPALEKYELLASKYAGGEDVLKEIFSLQDQGGRKLALRYALTEPMCRVVATNPQIPKPFKRYQMQPVWRDGPLRAGRYREFWQCDVDIIGVKSVMADAEILAIVEDVFRQFGINIITKVNDRKLLFGLVEQAGISAEDKQAQAIMSIDKLGKIGKDEVKKELLGKGFKEKEIETLLKLVSVRGKTNAETIKKLEKIVRSGLAKEGLAELKELLDYAKYFGLKSIEVEPSLARGLAIYTGPIYEVFAKKSVVTGSIAGGGRFDKIIAKWTGSAEDVPATGISFGLSAIVDVLEEKKKLEKRKTAVKVFIIPIGLTKEAIMLAQELRKNKINTDLDLAGRGISKNLDYANKMGIPYVIFLGEKELRARKVKLRDMRTGKEGLFAVKELIKKLANP